MRRFFCNGLVGLLCAGLFITVLLTGCDCKKNTEHTGSMFAMDTYMTFTVYGENGEESIAMAKQEIQRLDRMLSTGDENSEVSMLNRDGEGVLSKDLEVLWENSLKLYEMTDGSFDVTIYPVMRAWGFAGDNFRVPGEQELRELLERVDSSRVSRNEEKDMLMLPMGAELDFGGIAKGYAGDRLKELLVQQNVESALLDLGGNIQLVGSKPDGSDFKIGIKDPEKENQNLGVLSISDVAIVTSGGYERYFEEKGVRYHHVIDPATGMPADNGLKSVTIVCENGMMADGYSTALYVMGKEKAIRFWKEHKDSFEAVLLADDGTLYVTEGLKNCFTSKQKVTILSAVP